MYKYILESISVSSDLNQKLGLFSFISFYFLIKALSRDLINFMVVRNVLPALLIDLRMLGKYRAGANWQKINLEYRWEGD